MNREYIEIDIVLGSEDDIDENVDLGLSDYGLDWFKLYEKVL